MGETTSNDRHILQLCASQLWAGEPAVLADPEGLGVERVVRAMEVAWAVRVVMVMGLVPMEVQGIRGEEVRLGVVEEQMECSMTRRSKVAGPHSSICCLISEKGEPRQRHSNIAVHDLY